MSPNVSVVMGVYNGASHLPLTLDSVLSQKGVEFEFIVVNDGSTDESGKVLDWYASRDGRMRVIRQERAGLTRALIAGCAAAKGDFIARQDAGDVSLPSCLKSQVAVLRDHEDCVLVSCWTDMIGPQGEFLYTARGTGAACRPINILSSQTEWGVIDGPTSHPSAMFRSKQYFQCGGYRREFYYGQDWDLWYRLASLGTFCTVQESLCECRITLGSISAAWKQEQTKFAQLSRDAMLMRLRGLSDEPIVAEARQVLLSLKGRVTRRHKAAANYFIGKCLMDNRDYAAVGYLASAIKQDPLYLKAWIGLTRALFAKSKNKIA